MLRDQPRPSLCCSSACSDAEDVAVPGAVGVELEIALFAKQPEAVADFPRNLHRRERPTRPTLPAAMCVWAAAHCIGSAPSSAHAIIDKSGIRIMARLTLLMGQK